MPDIISQLRDEEGEKLYAYQDHLGYWTIGVGILIDARKGGGITKEESTYLLNNRVKKIESQIEARWPWSKTLNDARQAVLIGMAFQMGIDGLAGFTTTLSLVYSGKYKEAGDQMLKSKWAKQTPGRASRMADQMRTGEWQSG